MPESDSEPQNSQSPGVLTLNLGEGGKGDVSVRSPDDRKEDSATMVASGVLFLFLVFVVLLSCYAFHLVASRPTAEAKALVADAIIPVIKEVGNFSTSVFAPLLAFVLGYYFSQKRR